MSQVYDVGFELADCSGESSRCQEPLEQIGERKGRLSKDCLLRRVRRRSQTEDFDGVPR